MLRIRYPITLAFCKNYNSCFRKKILDWLHSILWYFSKSSVLYKPIFMKILFQFLIITVQQPNLSHPFHLHGYAFNVIGMGRSPDRNVKKINLKHALDRSTEKSSGNTNSPDILRVVPYKYSAGDAPESRMLLRNPNITVDKE